MNCTVGCCNHILHSQARLSALKPKVGSVCGLPACKRFQAAALRPAQLTGRPTLHPASAASDPDFDTAEAEGIEEAPEDARGAIAVGLKYYKAGNYQKALELFGSAPGLPGTGTKRFR